MYDFEQRSVIEHIEEIINRSRYGEELFFTDCKKAAIDILSFLESKKHLLRKEAEVEINYNLQREAA
jgi:hypothetical protein